jgi:hypothetical protein
MRDKIEKRKGEKEDREKREGKRTRGKRREERERERERERVKRKKFFDKGSKHPTCARCFKTFYGRKLRIFVKSWSVSHW